MMFDKNKFIAECHEPEYPQQEIDDALAAGKCGDCYACCAGYHEQCKGKDYDWYADFDNEDVQ